MSLNNEEALVTKLKRVNSKLNNRVKVAKKSKFIRSESENILVKKQAISLLTKRLVEIEQQRWGNVQYSRRGCLKLVDTPDFV